MDTIRELTHLEREIQRSIDNLRRNVQKVINDYDVPMMEALQFMATLGPLEEAAISIPKGQDYMDAITVFCRDWTLATIPPSAPKPKPDDSKPHIIGFGADRHIDTGVIKMPVRKNEPQQQTLDTDKPASQPTTVLGNPIPDDAPVVEISQDIKDKMAAIEASAKEPDLSDVTKLKAATKIDFEVDELGDTVVIPAEIIDEKPKSDADEFLGPKVEREPLPMLDPNKEVARLLNEAFPDATPQYKTHFFQESVGFRLVTEAVLSMGASDMYRTLNNAIASAKTNPIETLDEQKTSVENPTEKLSQNGQSAVSTNTDSDKPKQEQTLPQNSSNPMALATVSENNMPAIYEPKRSRLIPTREECEFVFNYSRAVAASRFYKGVDTPEKAQVIMFKGLSIGIQALDALDGYDVIDDPKRGISLYPRVKLLRGLVERTGLCRRFDIAGDDKKCTVTIQREGRSPNSYTFTVEDARKMNLLSKYNWQVMQPRMLMYRACSLGINAEFPEVNYSFGQAVATDDEDEEIAA